MSSLELDGREVAERGVPTVRVVPALDEVEDRDAGLGLRAEAVAIEQLAFERGEEALAHRVVVSVADRAHRRPDAGLAAALAEGDRRVLAALVGVMDDARAGRRCASAMSSACEDELGAQVRRHRPADDAPAPHIEHDRQVEEARPGRDVGDVGDPEPIRAGGREVPLHQIGRRPRVAVAASS